MPCSAAAEWWLAGAVRDGLVAYVEGASDARLVPLQRGAGVDAAAAHAAAAERLSAMQSAVFGRFGDTGVLRALSAAVALLRPLTVFPVIDLATLESATDPSAPEVARCTGGPDALSVSLLLRPNSTVGDLYEALRHSHIVDGDFVRAERRVVGSTAASGAGGAFLQAALPGKAGGAPSHAAAPAEEDLDEDLENLLLEDLQDDGELPDGVPPGAAERRRRAARVESERDFRPVVLKKDDTLSVEAGNAEVDGVVVVCVRTNKRPAWQKHNASSRAQAVAGALAAEGAVGGLNSVTRSDRHR